MDRKKRILTQRTHGYLVAAAGVLIGMILLGITGMSDVLVGYGPVEPQPVAAFVALMMAAGLIYTTVVLLSRFLPDSKGWRNRVLLTAIALRLTMAAGTPVMEDDHYRYLWDGALVAHGLNPYRYVPGDVRREAPASASTLLRQLADESGPVLDRVNYPWLRTIYPPLAQAAFGLAHYLSPWQLWGWRLVLAVFELTTLFILCRIKVPLTGLLAYGWNPLLIKEVYNSGHVDALMLPFLVSAVTAASRRRPLSATAALGVAAGVKLWPLMLMPMIWQRLTKRPLMLAASVTLSAAFLAAALLPLVLSGWNPTSGLAVYIRYWEMNDALYALLAWGIDSVTTLLPMSPVRAAMMPRLAAAAIVAVGIVWLVRRRDMALGQRCLMATTLLLMVSPTQFPWYYLWLMPFLALHPHPALILYTALLPLYYLRPMMEIHHMADAFDRFVVWIQHGPVMIWLIRDWLMRRQPKATGA